MQQPSKSAQAAAAQVTSGQVRAAAQLMNGLEGGQAWAVETLQELKRSTSAHSPSAHLIGITGPPGAGKSTLTSLLAGNYLTKGKRVGVVAVDPSSPLSGGAILGDRIRMQEHALHPELFIRSLATQGRLGGLSRSASDVVRVMEAMGKDIVLIETVGVGQDELDVVELAETVVLVAVPGLGDDIQAIKAGILEVADIFVVNKSDLSGADRVVRDLRQLLELRRLTASEATSEWEPPIIQTSQAAQAFQTSPTTLPVSSGPPGLDQLMDAFNAHRLWLEESGERSQKKARRSLGELRGLLQERLPALALAQVAEDAGGIEALATGLTLGKLDAYELVSEISQRLTKRRADRLESL